jgi:serine/threonine protein kinase
VLKLLSHPNVINAKKIELHQGYLYIVFEYCDMNLTDFMREKQASESRNLMEDEIRVIMKQVLQGLEYIHSQGYLHRDIKPENFIISAKSYDVKMIDFGTVKDI